jgi:hypothetical protein
VDGPGAATAAFSVRAVAGPLDRTGSLLLGVVAALPSRSAIGGACGSRGSE